MAIRRLAERLSRGVVLRRRLPSKFGRVPMYVTPEAGLRYWFSMSQVDPVLYRMAEEIVKPGSVVWDVGANVGLFTFCAASMAGKAGSVLAIEPDVLCASVSDSNRISQLAIAQRARSSNYLVEATGSTEASGARCLQPTVTVTLDFLMEHFPHPSVLKIDAETHEGDILQGGERLLKEARPTIWCEVSAENSSEVTELLHASKYELYGAQVSPHQLTSRAWFHTLALPLPLA
jgi:FkbM family methyltransferase